MKIRSRVLHNLLHQGETIIHPVYFICVAIFGHGPYAAIAGVLALITFSLLFIKE